MKLLLLSLLLAFCSANAETIVERTIWSGEVTVYSDVIIETGATLEIKAGTNVFLADGANIIVNGRLIATGSVEEPILFSPISAGRFWGGIIFNSDEICSLSLCEFTNGGRSTKSQNSMLLFAKGESKLQHIKLDKTFNYGITILSAGSVDLGGGESGSIGKNTFLGFDNEKLAILNKSVNDISAISNCWGGTNPEDVIFHKADNRNRGEVFFLPFIDDCEPEVPPVPKPISPLNGSGDIPLNVTLRWLGSAKAESYEITFSPDTTKSANIYKSESESLLLPKLGFLEKHYWRARAENFAGKSNWSEWFHFTTYDTSKPKNPILKYTNENELFFCSNKIAWEGSPNTNFYRVRLFDDKTGESLYFFDSLFVAELPEVELKPNGRFLISIMAFNRNGSSEWADYRFSMGGVFSDAIEIDYELNEVPKLIDFDSDDTPEKLLYSTSNKSTVSINSLDGRHIQTFADDIRVNDIAVIDADNDGDSDIFIAGADADNRLYLNNDGLLLPSDFEFEGEILSVSICDYNLDSRNDLLVKVVVNNKYELRIISNTIGNFHYAKTIFQSDNDFTYELTNLSNSDKNDIVILNDEELSLIIDYNFTYKFETNYDAIVCNDLLGSSESEIAAITGDKIDILQLDSTDITLVESHIINDDISNIKIVDYNSDNKNDILIATESVAYLLENNSCWEVYYSIPENLRYSFSDDALLLEWDKVSGAIGYKVYISDESGNYINSPKSYEIDFGMLSPDAYSVNYLEVRALASGRYFWSVSAVFADGNQSEFADESIFVTSDFLQLPPDSWAYESKTGSNTTYILRNTTKYEILERTTRSSDALGAFFYRNDSLFCAGYALINESGNTALTIWGDNAQTAEHKDGFEAFESYRWKFWDSMSGREIPVALENEYGSQRFVPDTVAVVEKVIDLDSYKVALPAGKWIMTASPILPWFAASREFLNESIKTKIGNEFLWDSDKAYYLFTETLDTVEFIGSRIELNGYSQPILTGLNQIPYSFDRAMSIEDYFGSRSEELIVKDSYGRLFSKELGLTDFQNLHPGRGYKVYSNSIFSVRNLEDSVFIDTQFAEPDLPATGSEMNLVVLENLLGNIEIELFSENRDYVIVKQITLNESVNIILNGDNPLTPEKDGFGDGERVFIAIRMNNNELQTKNLEMKTLLSGVNHFGSFTFKSDEILTTRIDDTILTSVQKRNDVVLVSPNPVKESFTITLPTPDVAQIELCDVLGRVILDKTNFKQINSNTFYCNTSTLFKGIYILKVNSISTSADIMIIKE